MSKKGGKKRKSTNKKVCKEVQEQQHKKIAQVRKTASHHKSETKRAKKA